MNAFFKKHIHLIDFVSWLVVLLFFSTSAFVFQGVLEGTFWGALGIVLLMLIITISINVILESLRHHKRIGELAGYITNGPEALCVLVGLLNHKMLFAASVPIGSNFANPLLFAFAILLAGQLPKLFSKQALQAGAVLFLTAFIAAAFYLASDRSFYIAWMLVVLPISFLLYRMKPKETEHQEEVSVGRKELIVPAVLFLIAAGYMLDPVVSYTAESSKLPEGVIGFIVISFLSSWPEFRSSLALVKCERFKSAFVNVYVSNLTNLWLVVIGVIGYLFLE